jgi:hypothetical protein
LLDRLRAAARLRRTLVIAHSTSDHPGDMRCACERNAAACLVGLLRAHAECVLLP